MHSEQKTNLLQPGDLRVSVTFTVMLENRIVSSRGDAVGHDLASKPKGLTVITGSRLREVSVNKQSF